MLATTYLSAGYKSFFFFHSYYFWFAFFLSEFIGICEWVVVGRTQHTCKQYDFNVTHWISLLKYLFFSFLILGKSICVALDVVRKYKLVSQNQRKKPNNEQFIYWLRWWLIISIFSPSDQKQTKISSPLPNQNTYKNAHTLPHTEIGLAKRKQTLEKNKHLVFLLLLSLLMMLDVVLPTFSNCSILFTQFDNCRFFSSDK